MDFDFDHEVRLVTDSEFKSLYAWSLQEFSKDGKKIGRDQIPWIWPLYFTASEFQYARSIKVERQRGKDRKAAGEQTLEALAGEIAEELAEEQREHASYPVCADTESISATLQPGSVLRDGQFERDASFSMFGTARAIQDFTLRILKLDDDTGQERCSVWGCVRYTSEVDFRRDTQQDCMEIHLWLTPRRFRELREMLVGEGATLMQLSISGVSGFYSDWSPSISTQHVKVLTSGEEHGVVSPEGCEISPPRLGTVSEFELSLVHRARFDFADRTDVLGFKDAEEDEDELDLLGEEEEEGENEPEDLDANDGQDEDETRMRGSTDAEDNKETAAEKQPGMREPASPQQSSDISAQLLRTEQALRSLRVPLWVMVILLVLLLFR